MFLFFLIDFFIDHLILRHLFILVFLGGVLVTASSLRFTSSYKSLLQTWQRLTLERSWPPFRVSCPGEYTNSCLGSTVVSQKLYLLAK